MTGSRRFLCYDVRSINYKHNINIDKLWSEVYYLYSNKTKYWFDGIDVERIEENNEPFRPIHPYESKILKIFQPCSYDDAYGVITQPKCPQTDSLNKGKTYCKPLIN